MFLQTKYNCICSFIKKDVVLIQLQLVLSTQQEPKVPLYKLLFWLTNPATNTGSQSSFWSYTVHEILNVIQKQAATGCCLFEQYSHIA